ncbi:MAG: phosphoglucosamine mutase [Candidatus Nanoarchaeia archaeon]|nr:phosphoglucosamine mutase [Candidatus Nanoarchaeia archaeon]
MRKLFGTDGIRGKAYEYPINVDIAEKLGYAVALFSKQKKVAIGRDTRISGKELEQAAAKGVSKAGKEAVLLGILPTPAVAFLTRKLNAGAGIMISASHNPAEDNGLKVFSSEGYKLEDEKEETIESYMLNTQKETAGGKITEYADAKRQYIDFAKKAFNGSAGGIKIVVDCANGAACNVAKDIFSDLKAEVTAINDSEDGSIINRGCGALHTGSLKEAVLKEKADLGIALDGDADRIIAVDETGRELDGDYLLYICAKLMKDKNRLKNNTVVATSMSNGGFEESMRMAGIAVKETKVGDKYVIEEMRKNNYSLGGEQSGHIIIADYSTTGDGILCGLEIIKAIKEYKKPLSELANEVQKYPQVLINVPVREKKEIKSLDSYALIQKAEKDLEGKGRVLVRYSGTEILLRVMVESKETPEIYAKEIADSLRKELS